MRRGCAQTGRRAEPRLSILHWRCEATGIAPARRHLLTFQYSIGDAILLAVLVLALYYMSFNTPLEMPPRETFGSWLDRVFAFQYSIGDAGGS